MDWLEEEDKLAFSERCESLLGLCSGWPESLAESGTKAQDLPLQELPL